MAAVRYLLNIALGLDLLASTLTGGLPGETISGRLGAAQRDRYLWGLILAPLVNLLAWNRNHCQQAIDGDAKRAKAVIAAESK